MERMRDAAKGNEFTVGIHEAEGDQAHENEAGLSVLEVAMFHEFGLGVPRRSFISDWADENEERHKAQIRAMAKAVVAGKVESVEMGMMRLANLYAGEVQKRIADNIPPPLAQSTIDQKGSSVALINTGQMRSSVAPYVNGVPLK